MDANESLLVHRLYPNGVMQVRYCLRDTTLLLGGGKDGKGPIYVKRGDVLQVNKSDGSVFVRIGPLCHLEAVHDDAQLSFWLLLKRLTLSRASQSCQQSI